MKQSKGFTLIELLVVIAVIGLLMAVIMPALQKAKELGRRVVSTNNMRSFAMANELYSQKWDGWYVPAYDPSNTNGHWTRNQDFIDMVGASDMDDNVGGYEMPQEFYCPSDTIVRDDSLPWSSVPGSVRISYGMNMTDWPLWGPDAVSDDTYCGFRVTNLKLPAQRIAWGDGNDWWLDYWGADYKIGWDVLGQAFIQDYKDINVHGPVIFRHGDGACFAFYDGHAEWLRKEDCVQYQPGAASLDPTDKPTAMWTNPK